VGVYSLESAAHSQWDTRPTVTFPATLHHCRLASYVSGASTEVDPGFRSGGWRSFGAKPPAGVRWTKSPEAGALQIILQWCTPKENKTTSWQLHVKFCSHRKCEGGLSEPNKPLYICHWSHKHKPNVYCLTTMLSTIADSSQLILITSRNITILLAFTQPKAGRPHMGQNFRDVCLWPLWTMEIGPHVFEKSGTHTHTHRRGNFIYRLELIRLQYTVLVGFFLAWQSSKFSK